MRDLAKTIIGDSTCMIIDNKFKITDRVAVRLTATDDEEAIQGFVTAIMILPNDLLMYEVSRGCLYYAFELEKVI